MSAYTGLAGSVYAAGAGQTKAEAIGIKRRYQQEIGQIKIEQTQRLFSTLSQLLRAGKNLAEIYEQNSEVSKAAEQQGLTPTKTPWLGIFGKQEFYNPKENRIITPREVLYKQALQEHLSASPSVTGIGTKASNTRTSEGSFNDFGMKASTDSGGQF